LRESEEELSPAYRELLESSLADVSAKVERLVQAAEKVLKTGAN
jgi:hypothetical protein